MSADKLTVTIGIPANNEAATISTLLESIANQVRDSFVLEKVIVACDGCTDSTAQVAKEFTSCTVIDDGQRLGQAGRLSEFYKLNTSDVFITFDADTKLANNYVLEELVKPFASKDVGIVGGNPIPYKAQNLFENIVVTWIRVWYETRKNLFNGTSIHNHNGKISAVRKEAVDNFVIPNDVYANDDFLYISVIRRGFKFAFAPKAIVLYRAPNNIRDYFLQHGRFVSLKDRMFEYFGDEVKEMYYVPIDYKLKAVVHVALRSPLYLSFAIVFETILRKFKDRLIEHYKGVSWTEASSTKDINKDLGGAFS